MKVEELKRLIEELDEDSSGDVLVAVNDGTCRPIENARMFKRDLILVTDLVVTL